MTDNPTLSPVQAAAEGVGALDRLVTELAPRLADCLLGRLVAGVTENLRLETVAGDDLVLTRSDAARFLGRSVKTMEVWAAEGKGPKVLQIGPRAVGYRLGDLRAFVRDELGRAGQREIAEKHLKQRAQSAA